jgi:hypothetical protein
MSALGVESQSIHLMPCLIEGDYESDAAARVAAMVFPTSS